MIRYTCPNCGAEGKSIHVGPDQWHCPVCQHDFCTAAGAEAAEFWKGVRKQIEISAEKN